MTIAVEGAGHGDGTPPGPGTARTPLSSRAMWLFAAGLLSLGAGAVHAAAIGVHAEARPAAMTFTAIAAIQLAWGGLALVRSNRVVAALGVALGVGALAGWAVAKTSGIGFVEGLDVAEPVQVVDAMAAGMAALSAVLAGVSMAASAEVRLTRAAVPRVPLSVVATLVAIVSVYGMVTAGTHVHQHGDGSVETAAAGHTHTGTEAATGADTAAHAADGTHADGSTDHQAVAPVPYDPTKPIDLSGVPGVTPEQQAAAENTIAVTLVKLPQWADFTYAEANGFQSIGDGLTGVEHFINQAYMDDDIILDPDKPESLVYDTAGGGKRLVAAMYMLERGTPLSEVPDIGGSLMQWHIHDNLCYRPNGKLGGLTDANGNCREGLIKRVPTPMIHVWIEPHECGPFAALEGIGGGSVADGEEVLCDHVHGA